MEKYQYISWAQNIIVVTAYGLLFFFLVLNIVYSQDFPPLYFKLAREEDSALVDFMKNGKDLSIFPFILPEIEKSYTEHNAQIYEEDRQRQATIMKLELLLTKNPKATEVLYSLYLLYQKDGDVSKAEDFLQQAQKLDPSLTR